MCNENVYEKITDEYIKRRKEFFKNRQASFISFYKRAVGKIDEFKRLI